MGLLGKVGAYFEDRRVTRFERELGDLVEGKSIAFDLEAVLVPEGGGDPRPYAQRALNVVGESASESRIWTAARRGFAESIV